MTWKKRIIRQVSLPEDQDLDLELDLDLDLDLVLRRFLLFLLLRPPSSLS